MIKSLLIFFASILLCSCNTHNLPKNVLPAPQMESILWDLIRVDQLLSIQYATDTTVNRTLKSKEMYRQVLSLHKVSEKVLKESLRFYEKNPRYLKPILDSLRVKPADSVIRKIKVAQ